jgi:hypothetical protein
MAKRRNVVQQTTQVSPRTESVNGKIDFARNELNLLLPTYYMIRDAIEGEMAIKGIVSSSTGFVAPGNNGGLPNMFTNIVLTRAMRYLPQPNPEDNSDANLKRYKSYVQRANYYNVISRTLEGLAGQIFLRDPVTKIPAALSMLQEDADGSGLKLDQVANRAVRSCISYGRAGLLIDYPITNGAVTKAQVEKGVRPVMLVYYPWDIINWRVEMINAKKTLTFVVLREVLDETAEDGFQLSTFEQYRVLSLDDNGVHQAQIYRAKKTNVGSGGFERTADYTPTDSKGNTFDAIPFTFIGSENNDVAPNKPPLYDLAALNIAHYRNSADYEEACYIAGQPTPVLTGLSQDWVENVLKGTVTLGSRGAIPLPVGADAKLLQAQENSMPIEAMKQKEAQMVSLGAKLVQIQKTARTATQQIIETTSESSPLANISKNVSAAIEFGLNIAGRFVGTSETASYQLNKDFDLTSMTADDQNAVVLQWQSAAISFGEMRTVLRRAGTATLEDAKAKLEIQQDINDGLIPDPAQSAQPQSRAPLPKGESDAGGPQPKRPRRQPSPGTNA